MRSSSSWLFGLYAVAVSDAFRLGNFYGFDPVLGPPSRIYRAKASMNGYKMVMNVQFAGTQVFDMYNMRVRWTEPHEWNDGKGLGHVPERNYDLRCWIRDKEQSKQLFHHRIGSYYQGYNEKFRFPANMDIYTTCAVRAVNAVGNATGWRETNSLRVKDIPVYMPGLEGIDLRGLGPEDIATVLASVAFPQGNTDKAKEANATTVLPSTDASTTTLPPTTMVTTTTTPPSTTSTSTASSSTSAMSSTTQAPTTAETTKKKSTRRPWWIRGAATTAPAAKETTTATTEGGRSIGTWWASTAAPTKTKTPRARKLLKAPLKGRRKAPLKHKALKDILAHVPLPDYEEESRRRAQLRHWRRLRMRQVVSRRHAPFGQGFQAFWH